MPNPKELIQDAAAHIECGWEWLKTCDLDEVRRLAVQADEASRILKVFGRLAWNNYFDRRGRT